MKVNKNTQKQIKSQANAFAYHLQDILGSFFLENSKPFRFSDSEKYFRKQLHKFIISVKGRGEK